MNRPISFSAFVIVALVLTAACDDDTRTNLDENESTNSDPAPEAPGSWIKRAPLPEQER